MTTSRRYNADEYVTAYRQHRRYPKIHDTIFDVCAEWLPDAPTLDLMSSTGLLGARIRDILGLPVIAADGDLDAISRGVYDDTYPVLPITLTPDTMPTLAAWIRDHGVTNLVARRCLCVLTEAVPPDQITATLHDAGITTIVLEGQLNVGRNTHPYGKADAQVSYLTPTYRLRHTHKDVRVLTT